MNVRDASERLLAATDNTYALRDTIFVSMEHYKKIQQIKKRDKCDEYTAYYRSLGL